MKEGPAAAMEALYQQHGAAILRYLDRHFGRIAPAEDLLQETFVQALGCQSQCATAASPRAFLFGIARHVGLAAVRRSRPTVVAQIEPAAAVEDPALIDMRAAIQQLPERVRETLELRLGEQLSYEEIAAVLDIPVGTVRSRLHTALRLLRHEMNPPHGTQGEPHAT